jgi:hypothetical protein
VKLQNPYNANSETILTIAAHVRHDRSFLDGPSLSRNQISEIVNTLFWTSLNKEEGKFAKLVVHIVKPPKICLRLPLFDIPKATIVRSRPIDSLVRWS